MNRPIILHFTKHFTRGLLEGLQHSTYLDFMNEQEAQAYVETLNRPEIAKRNGFTVTLDLIRPAYDQTLTKRLMRYAYADLKTARENGECMIAQTRKGNITVECIQENEYRLTSSSYGYIGSKRQCAQEIAQNLYDVVMEAENV